MMNKKKIAKLVYYSCGFMFVLPAFFFVGFIFWLFPAIMLGATIFLLVIIGYVWSSSVLDGD